MTIFVCLRGALFGSILNINMLFKKYIYNISILIKIYYNNLLRWGNNPSYTTVVRQCRISMISVPPVPFHNNIYSSVGNLYSIHPFHPDLPQLQCQNLFSTHFHFWFQSLQQISITQNCLMIKFVKIKNVFQWIDCNENNLIIRQ